MTLLLARNQIGTKHFNAIAMSLCRNTSWNCKNRIRS